MKYHVYAALIAASTQAGPVADAFEKNMPTKADTEAAEAKLDAWAQQAENITNTAKPIIKSRNTKIVNAWNYAGEQAERELNDFGKELEGNLKDLDEKLIEIDQYAMEDLEAAGVIEDKKKLEAKIKKDLEACQKAMVNVRQSTMSLKAIKFSDDFHDAMPTKEEVAKVEATVDGWINRGEDLKDRAIPSIKARNERIKAAWQSMEEADEKVTLELIDDLEKAQMDFTKDLTRAQERLERTLTSNGTVADFEALEDQIEADLQKMEQMHSVVMKMHPAVAHKVVENEIKKDIARKHVTKKAIEREIVKNEIKKELHNLMGRNPAVAHKVVENEIKKDIARKHVTKKAIEKEIVKNEIKKANRAANRLSHNLAEVSAEMESDKVTAEEWEDKKSMVISWVSDFEDIMAKAEPIGEIREQEIEYELEQFEEEFEELFEETLKDLEKTDKEFTAVHDQANEDMVNQLKASGAVDQFKDLADDIDATLSEMERCMSKVKRSASLLKIQQRRGNTLSLGQVADAMKADIPTGKEVVEVEGMVTGWVKKAEAIETKAKPAVERRDKQVEKAFKDTLEEVEEEAKRAFDEFERNDMEFVHKVETAEYDMLDTWNNTGIIADAEKLGGDIELQFNTWEKNMARRAPVQSLTAKQSRDVSQNLRSLEADLDMVLKSM